MNSTQKSKVNILQLAEICVFNEEGVEVKLSSFWENGTAILIFLRHFGCMACRAHVDQIWNLKKDIQSLKRKIVFIGNGSPDYIVKFKQDIGAQDAPVYTDPSKLSFDACGFSRGITNLVHIKSMYNFYKLKQKGYTQGELHFKTGNHFQMGGIVVIRPPGQVVYYFESKHAGDFEHPDDWKIIKNS